MTLNSPGSDRYLIVTGSISILLILFLVSLSGTSFIHNLFGLSKINTTVYFISRMLYWVCLVFLWLYSTKIEKQNLLIWKEKKYTFLTYLASIIAIFLVLFVGLLIIQQLLSLTGINKKSNRLLEIITILRVNKVLLIFTALTAGIVEEFIFRGYLQPRFEIIFKKSYLAIILSSLFFGLLHYGYGTIFNIAGPFFIGLVFAYYYWRYRNIKILMLCHFLWDLISLFILVKIH